MDAKRRTEVCTLAVEAVGRFANHPFGQFWPWSTGYRPTIGEGVCGSGLAPHKPAALGGTGRLLPRVQCGRDGASQWGEFGAIATLSDRF
jgi:hypothetical protein